MSDGIHFWSPVGPTDAELRAWVPDADPTRFASGFGHNVLELVVRLRRAGVGATFGSEVPRGTHLVVLFGWLSVPRRYRSAVVRGALRARGRVALIRSDIPLDWRFPLERRDALVATGASLDGTGVRGTLRSARVLGEGARRSAARRLAARRSQVRG